MPNCNNGHMGHDHNHATGRAEDRVRLRIVLVVTLVVMVVEVVGALLTGSLALLADAGHMLSDLIGLVIALVAAFVAARRLRGAAARRHQRVVCRPLREHRVLAGRVGPAACAGLRFPVSFAW